MWTGWIRVFALIGVAALLANAQCYDKCVSADSSPEQPPSKSCHHQKPCPPQHPQIARPEAGIAKISLAPATVPALSADTVAAAADRQIFVLTDTGSPPAGRCGSTLSILRI